MPVDSTKLLAVLHAMHIVEFVEFAQVVQPLIAVLQAVHVIVIVDKNKPEGQVHVPFTLVKAETQVTHVDADEHSAQNCWQARQAPVEE